MVWGRGAKKSSDILSHLISTSLPTSSTSGVSRKLAGELQQEKVSGHTERASSQGGAPAHHPFLPLAPTTGRVWSSLKSSGWAWGLLRRAASSVSPQAGAHC